MSDLDAIKLLLDGSYRGAESKFKNHIKLLKQENETLKNQITDLEAKLAESEEYNQMLLEEKSGYIDLVSGYSKKCKNYEQQLAEKDKEIKELLNYDRCSHCSYGQANKEYREKCSELIEELAEVKNSCDYYMNRANDLLLKDQDKISFCIEQLEKAKKTLIKNSNPIGEEYEEDYFRITVSDIKRFINNQTEELKKEMK